MAHLTWLHLSDWHQTGKDFDRKVVRDKLIDDLTNRAAIDPRLATIDFIVFSGDLTAKGTPEEFQAAREHLLDPVLQATGLEPDLLFIVPGNHDLQRSTVTVMLPPELQKPMDSDEVVNRWLTDERKRARALEPFEAYTEFVSSYTKQSQPAFASVRRFNMNGIDVALLGLNSAWMCGRNKDSSGETNDYGYLVVGEPQIHESLREISVATLRIAVLHHPFKWLKEFDQSKIEQDLKRNCHFILRGHEHQPDADWSSGPQGECVTIPAGASYNRRKETDTRYVNAYNFVHLDLDKASGVIFFRRWSERQKAWIEDGDTCLRGQLQFSLPKQLAISPAPASQTTTSATAISNEVALEADYRRQTIETFKDLTFKGLTASVRPILLPLEKVYVQLRAVAEVPESADEFTPEERRVLRWMEEEREGLELHAPDLQEAQMRLDALRRERWTKDRLERFPIADALRDPKRRGLVILGDPGSGKTTLLHFLALVFAQGPHAAAEHLQLSGDEGDRLPIFAPLAAYDDMLNRDSGLTVQNFLAKYYAQRRMMPGLEKLFDPAIEKGRALILLDGMDEVLEEGRRKFVADQASAFIRALIHRGNRVLLTSRIYGYRVAPLSVELPHVTVLDFRREEIEVFARQWNNAMAEWEYADRPAPQRLAFAREEEKALLDEIESNPGVERLAANPLLLSMLALLRRQVGRLPQQRIRLYALYLGTLIDAWEASRSPGARVDAPARPEAGRVELVLIPLALWLQQNKPSGTATEAEILAQIINVFLREEGLPAETAQDTAEWGEAHIRAKKFLEDMRRYSGLLVERGQGVFGFRHLTFQEYYVGRALARMEATKRWDLLHANLHANRWREPILLAAAQLGNMQADVEACTKLVNQILDAQSPHEEILHRDLFLAADCAGDDINVHIVTLRRIVEELKVLLGSPIPTVVGQTIQRFVNLARLISAGKPRLPEVIDILIAAMPPQTGAVHLIDKFIPLVSPLFQAFPILRDTVLQPLADDDPYQRAAAIRGLAGLVADDSAVREAIISRLDDGFYWVREAAIQSLGGLLVEDESLRNVVAKRLDDKETHVQRIAIAALSPILSVDRELRQKVTDRLSSTSYFQRGAAIAALSGFVAEDESLRQRIVSMLKDSESEVRLEAIRALSGLAGEHAELRQDISRLLDDPSGGVQITAIAACGTVLHDDPVLQEAVAKKLSDPDASIRKAAVGALHQIKAFEPRLRELLQHPDWQTRLDTIYALDQQIRGDVNVGTILGKVISNLSCLESDRARANAVQSLAVLLEDDLSLREQVMSKLMDESYLVRSAAIQALSRCIMSSESVREAILERIEDSESPVRQVAIRTLTPLLATDQSLCEVIEQLLDDQDSAVRTAAMEALVDQLTSKSKLLQVFIDLLENEFSSVSIAAIEALTGFLDDPRVSSALRKRLKAESMWVRGAAINALSGLPSIHAEVVESAYEMLTSGDLWSRMMAVQSLGNIANLTDKIRDLIAQRFNDPDIFVRAMSIRISDPLLRANASLRDEIVNLLNDENPILRGAALQALTGMLSEVPGLRERLNEMLKDPDSSIRANAITALADSLPQNPALVDTVITALDSSDESERIAAISALMPFLSSNEELKNRFVKKLESEVPSVRIALAVAVAPFVADADLREKIRPALGLDDYAIGRFSSLNAPRHSIIEGWIKWARMDPQAGADAIAMLDSKDWRLRLSAGEILTSLDADGLRKATPQLVAEMDNHDGLDSFPARIAAAEILINHSKYCKQAIEVLISALDYGTHPLAIVPMASEIRTSAATALGKLKAEDYQPEAVEKLKQSLQTEREPAVLDGLFNAILSLASAPV